MSSPLSTRSKPLLVLVGGPGGAGKSTLARALADALQLVHLSRDTVKAAIAVTEAKRTPDGSPTFDAAQSAMGGEFGQRAFAATYDAAGLLLRSGVSVIIDQAWRVGRSEAELEPLVALARAAHVHVSTSPPVARERAQARGHRDGLAGVDEALIALRTDWEKFGPLKLGIPTLVVDATDGYTPSFNEISAWLWANTAQTH